MYIRNTSGALILRESNPQLSGPRITYLHARFLPSTAFIMNVVLMVFIHILFLRMMEYLNDVTEK